MVSLPTCLPRLLGGIRRIVEPKLGSSSHWGCCCRLPQPIHGGSAVTLAVNGVEVTEPAEVLNVAPLNPETHPAMRVVQEGTRVRVIGLTRRTGGTMPATIRTVVVRMTTYRMLFFQPRAMRKKSPMITLYHNEKSGIVLVSEQNMGWNVGLTDPVKNEER